MQQSRSVSPARGERQGGEGLLSPAVQRALANRRAALAADARIAISTPGGGVPAGALPQPSAPTPSGQPAEPLDGGVSVAARRYRLGRHRPTQCPLHYAGAVEGSAADPNRGGASRTHTGPGLP